MELIHFIIPALAIIYGIIKAASERVVDFYSWTNSIFAFKYHKDTTVDDLRQIEPKFTHPREVSWARKDAGSKFMQKLKHTVLVGITDLWHFADTVTALIAFILIPITILFTPELNTFQYLALFVGSWVAYAASFHLFYHKFLYFAREHRTADLTTNENNLNESNIQNG